jgi:hypothetical protein
VKFHENSSSGGQVNRCGRTDRHDEANKLFFTTLPTSLKNDKDFDKVMGLLNFVARKVEALQVVTRP